MLKALEFYKIGGSNAAHGAHQYSGYTEAFTDPDGEAYMIAHLQTRNDNGDRDIYGWIRDHFYLYRSADKVR